MKKANNQLASLSSKRVRPAISCTAAYLQTGQVVATLSPLLENRVGVAESSEEPNVAPGGRRLHLHIGRHAAVPDGLYKQHMSHLSGLPTTPLAHGGFFPLLHDDHQDPQWTMDRMSLGLHGGHRKHLRRVHVCKLFSDGDGRWIFSGESKIFSQLSVS